MWLEGKRGNRESGVGFSMSFRLELDSAELIVETKPKGTQPDGSGIGAGQEAKGY